MEENGAWGSYPGWASSYGQAAKRYNSWNSIKAISSPTNGLITLGGYFKDDGGKDPNRIAGSFQTVYVGEGYKRQMQSGIEDLGNWFSTKNGDISNHLAGWGYMAGAIGNQVGKIIQANSLYGPPLSTTFLKTFVGNIEVSTKALAKTGAILRTAGIAAGFGGLLITYYQYKTEQITGKEAAVDAFFGAVGFIGPWGAAISVGYFGGKFLYEHFSGDTLFDKPTQ